MLRYGARLIAIVSVIAVCGALAACNAESRSPVAAEPTFSSSPKASSPLPSIAASPRLEPFSSSIDPSIEPSEETVAGVDDDGVGAAAAKPPGQAAGKESATAEDKPFDPGRPMLLGIALYDSDTTIAQRYGAAIAQYALPGDDSTIDMWEYAGYAFGFDGTGRVVYIEISSDEVSTGISGLSTGMPGAEAAELLEIAYHPDSHVLTLELDEGWLKLDLDPDTHEVLSIKLIGVS